MALFIASLSQRLSHMRQALQWLGATESEARSKPPHTHIKSTVSEIMPFLDFQIRAWRDGADRIQVLVHSSPAGEMRRPVDVLLRADPAARLRQIFPGALRSSEQQDVQEQMIEVGRQLSDILLPPPVLSLLLRSLERVGQGDGLRLRLCLEPPLSEIPWEFLYRPDVIEPSGASGFLVLDQRISLVREAPTNSVPVPPTDGKQRLVFAGALWVQGTGRVRSVADRWQVEPEYQEIKLGLRQLSDLLAIENFIDASNETLETALTQPAAIFHYSGHTDVENGRGYLVRGIGPGDSQSVMFSEELGFLLRRAQTRLGVFSACNSGRWEFVEPLLRSGLRALVGTLGRVTTIGATVFMQKLYSALAVGLSLDEAVTWARLQILLSGRDEEGRPSYEWGAFKVFMTTSEPILLPQPDRPEVRQRQQDVQNERHQTIINVHQTIGTVSGSTITGIAGNIPG